MPIKTGIIDLLFIYFCENLFLYLYFIQIIPQTQLYPCMTPTVANGNGLLGSYYTDMNLTVFKGSEIDAMVIPSPTL